MRNLFSHTETDLSHEATESLVLRDGFRVERIVSSGHASPEGFWYDQDEDEWVALLTGSARLRLLDPSESLELRPGDHLLIPAHRKHRVDWTPSGERTIWLAVYWNESQSAHS